MLERLRMNLGKSSRVRLLQGVMCTRKKKYGCTCSSQEYCCFVPSRSKLTILNFVLVLCLYQRVIEIPQCMFKIIFIDATGSHPSEGCKQRPCLCRMIQYPICALSPRQVWCHSLQRPLDLQTHLLLKCTRAASALWRSSVNTLRYSPLLLSLWCPTHCQVFANYS